MLSSELIDFFTQDHKSCDEHWLAVDNAVEAGDAAAVEAAWQRFRADTEHHFRMEEEVLFPAFEAATGMSGGPTSVMRVEHEQMRGLLAQMQLAVDSGDHEGLIDLGDTLLMVTQQHNMKEEGMLYPMAGQHLGGQWAELKARIDAL